MQPTRVKRQILLAAVLLLGVASTALAQGNSLAAQVRNLNNEMLRLHGQFLVASPNEQALLHSRAFAVSQQRAAALAALIAQDPSESLKLAFPPDVIAMLAETFPQSAGRFESHGAWQGPLYYLIEDDVTMTRGRSIRRMTVGGEQLEIHFAGVEPAGLKCNDVLRVRGVRAGQQVAAQDGSILASVAGASCSTQGAQGVIAILVNLPSYTLPSNVTPSFVSGVLLGNAYGSPASNPDWSVSDFWLQNSDGKTWVNSSVPVVTGPYLLSKDFNTNSSGGAYCDYEGLRAAAVAAADPYVNFQNYSRILFVFPNNGNICGWAGLGSLGCWTQSTQDGTVQASITWQRADQMPNRDYGVRLTTHEFGHNLTMHHASTRDFGAETLGPLGAAGTLNEYGDLFSTMGSWNLGFYSAQHAVQQLGWMAQYTNYLVVESGGTHTIQNYEARPAGVKALKIRRGTGNDAWLWLEYRQKVGIYDYYLGSQVYSGALIHLPDFYLPASNNFNDPALPVGTSWTDPYSNLTIRAVSSTADNLTVEVTYGAVPCTAANPTVTLSPSNPSVPAGGTVNYTVSVKNNDSAGCDSGSFTLVPTVPSGFSAGTITPNPLLVAPGQTGTANLPVTAGSSAGTYPVSVAATKGGYSSSGSANCTVTVPLTVGVTATPAMVSRNQTVTIAATVKRGLDPVSGASVTFTMTKAGGGKATKKATTGAGGTAEWDYTVGRRDPLGEYRVSATAKYGGQTVSSTAPATFTVQ